MARAISATAKAAMFAQETDQVFLLLVTISHASLPVPIRCVNDLVNLVSRGNTFIAFPFEISLPGESEDQLPRVQLRIDNVDRQIVQAARTLTTPPTVLLEVVLASAPDTVEAAFDFTLRNVEYDALVVTGDLAYEDVLNEGFPQHSFTPNLVPGLF